MKDIIAELLKETSITLATDDITNIVSNLDEAGVESFEDLKMFSQKEIAEIFKLKLLQNKKIYEAIQKKNNDESMDTELMEIPVRPVDYSTIGAITVTGNKTIDLKDVNDFLEFGILYGLGTEKIGKSLVSLLVSRMEELDEPASENIIKAFQVASKFENFDKGVASVLNFNLSLLPERHKMAAEIQNEMVKNVIEFVNDALQFRLDVANIDTLVLQRIAKAKVSNEVSVDLLQTSAEDLAVKISKNLRGLNSMIVRESLKLYKEVFCLIEDSEIQKFIGAKDTRDMLIKLGIKYTPKEVQGFNKVPELVYQLLYALEEPTKMTNQRLYVYLQNVWQGAKMFEWVKFGGLSNVKTDNSFMLDQQVSDDDSLFGGKN